MNPHEPYTNGDEGAAASGSASGSGSEDEDGAGGAGGAGGAAGELSLHDAGAPARALAALNALRKSRQHYDVVLVAGAGGGEVAAHRAVLAAVSPYLLRELPPAPHAPPAYRVEGVEAAPLRALVEYAYTGRLAVREAAAARALYRAAWRLRVEAVRAHLAERLVRRAAPASCLDTRALPDLEPAQLAALDRYIADNFEEVCESGALGTLPEIRIEMMRDSSCLGGEESPHAVASAALAWLLAHDAHDVEELCSRTHLVYVDARGALRDCGELPAARGDAPELQQYRLEAAARRRPAAPPAAAPPAAPAPAPAPALGSRAARPECGVVAARRAPGGSTRALLALRGRLAGARVLWSDVAAGGGGVARGAPLAGEAGADAAAEGGAGARLAESRAAHGAAALAGRLLVCGGYDRARVLRSAEAYEPATRAWAPLPAMRVARARFPAARLGDEVWAFGGSDGHAELDSVDAFSFERGWRAATRLPAPASHAAAAADERAGDLYVVGGWAGGVNLKRVWRYSPATDRWEEAAPLSAGRAQCAAVWWEGALWALGGCDAWRCLASTERLAAGGARWEAGPALPTARRSVGGAVWRGRLVSCGGSDGAASLRRTEWLAAAAGGGDGGAWRAGPPLRRARAALGLAVLGDALYAVGGFDGKQFLGCVERLADPDGEWTTLCAASDLRDLPAPPAPREQTENNETEPPQQ